MNILIVDGNEKEASDKYLNIGMDTQYDVYSKILKKIAKNNLNITVIHPAINDDFIPRGLSLEDFEGVAWTGSLLNIYDDTPSIKRQINLAKKLFDIKNSIFGSCWGLQVLVTAAGGKVRKNGKIKKVPLAYKEKVIDFCIGKFNTMTIPWGDVFTAYHSTGIPNIEFYLSRSPRSVKKIKRYRRFIGLFNYKWI